MQRLKFACYHLDTRVEYSRGQSIDLAVSIRGREALRAVGLEEAVISHGIAMHGRMIHNKDGTLKDIPYDIVNGNVSNFFRTSTLL